MELPRQGLYIFGEYRLDTVTRRLMRDGVTIKLAARLFDTLLYLVENDGRVVSQDELERAIWPGRQMERGNVARAISSLRTALKSDGADEQTIITLPGRGYRFGSLVTFVESAPPPPPLDEALNRQTDPDFGLTRVGSPENAVFDVNLAKPSRLPSPVISRAAVLSLAFLLLVGLAVIWSVPLRKAAPPAQSIAVLPFINTSGNPQQDYLADGFTDELINSLGNIGPLRVAGRPSSFSFKGKTPSMGDITRALNVAVVLDGTVKRMGKTMLVTAELTDTGTGYQLWSHRYSLDEQSFLSAERHIVDAVLGTMRIASSDNISKRAAGSTDNPAAFDFYMRAMSILRNDEHSTYKSAYDDLTKALALDPHYATALAQRARVLRVWWAHSPQALADAQQAVAFAPNLAFAHATLGRMLTLPPADNEKAKDEFAHALALAPYDAVTLLDYAFFDVSMGRFDDGLGYARQAVQLDPLTVTTHLRYALLSGLSGRFDEAATALRRAAMLGGHHVELRSSQRDIETWRGDAKSALETCRPRQDWNDLVCLAVAYNRLGDQPHAEEALAQVRAELGDDGAYNYAEIYAAWGRREDALKWLTRAYEMKDDGLSFLRVDPLLQSLRGTPELAALERQIGFIAPESN